MLYIFHTHTHTQIHAVTKFSYQITNPPKDVQIHRPALHGPHDRDRQHSFEWQNAAFGITSAVLVEVCGRLVAVVEDFIQLASPSLRKNANSAISRVARRVRSVAISSVAWQISTLWYKAINYWTWTMLINSYRSSNSYCLLFVVAIEC